MLTIPETHEGAVHHGGHAGAQGVTFGHADRKAGGLEPGGLRFHNEQNNCRVHDE